MRCPLLSWGSTLPTLPSAQGCVHTRSPEFSCLVGVRVNTAWKKCAGSTGEGQQAAVDNRQSFLQGQQPGLPFTTTATPDPPS